MYTFQIRTKDDDFLFEGKPLDVSFTSRWNKKGECFLSFSPLHINAEDGTARLIKEVESDAIIKPWNRVLVFLEDRKVWEGYINTIKDKNDLIELECVDFMGYAEKKLLPLGHNYNGIRAKYILDEIWDDINAVSNTGYTLDASYQSFYTLNVRAGETFAQILNKMIRRGAEIRVNYPKIEISYLLSRSATLSDGIKLLFDEEDAISSTIEPPKKVVTKGSTYINTLYAKGTTGVHIIRDVQAGEEEIAQYKYFRASGAQLQTEAEEYWDVLQSQKTYDIVPLPNKFGVADIKVGDIVSLQIISSNKRINTHQNFTVVEKTIKDSSPYITGLKIAKNKLEDPELAEVFERLSFLESNS